MHIRHQLCQRWSTRELTIECISFSVEGRPLRLQVSNCRNVRILLNEPSGDECLDLRENELNILFGSNGTGKTTLAKALQYACQSSEHIYDELRPYWLDDQDRNSPQAALLQDDRTPFGNLPDVMTFDRTWVAHHCFQKTSLRDDVYRLFISDSSIDKAVKNYSKNLQELRDAFSDTNIQQFAQASGGFLKVTGKPGIRGLTKASNAGKALLNGGPLTGLPSALQGVVDRQESRPRWLKWHLEGSKFVHAEEPTCPYCGSLERDAVEAACEFDEGKDSKGVSAWDKLANITDSDLKLLTNASTKIINDAFSGLDCDEQALGQLHSLMQLIDKVSTAIECVKGIIDFGRDESSWPDIGVENLTSHIKILTSQHAEFIPEENSAFKTVGIVLSKLIKSHDSLEQAREVARRRRDEMAERHSGMMNKFLEWSGYPYHVDIEGEKGSYGLILKDKESGKPVSDAEHSLSYGESNALSLALFFLEAAKSKNTIIVLDDPISSFDGDKRFAILSSIFSGQKASPFEGYTLCDKTVVLLTHDPLVLYDSMRLCHSTDGAYAQYLHLDENHVMHISLISKGDIKGVYQSLIDKLKKLADSNHQKGKLSLSSLVYLRQSLEFAREESLEFDDNGNIVRKDNINQAAAAFSILSSLLHRNMEPLGRCNDATKAGQPLPEDVVTLGQNEINRRLKSYGYDEKFDYSSWANRIAPESSDYLTNLYQQAKTPYAKLQVVRIMIDGCSEGMLSPQSEKMQDVINKYFANAAYHIGGEYIFKLDPDEYEQIPLPVMAWCDDIAEKYAEGTIKRSNASG